MTISGVDYFARLMTSLETTDAGQEGSQALFKLVEALASLSPENEQRVAYNSAMDQAAVLSLGTSIQDAEQDLVEDWLLSYPKSGDAEAFLERLVGDIDALIEDADIGPHEDGCERLVEPVADILTARANEIAREIANEKAAKGAREAAEEAYKLAYEWAYEDLFEEAYYQALSELVESSEAVPA